MAHSNSNVKTLDKPPCSDKLVIRSISWILCLYNSKRTLKMAEGKLIALFFADIFGGVSFLLGYISKLDSTKDAILFILGTIYIMARIFFYIRRNWVQLRKEEWEQAQREKK